MGFKSAFKGLSDRTGTRLLLIWTDRKTYERCSISFHRPYRWQGSDLNLSCSWVIPLKYHYFQVWFPSSFMHLPHRRASLEIPSPHESVSYISNNSRRAIFTSLLLWNLQPPTLTRAPDVHCMTWSTQYVRWNFLRDMGGVHRIG